MHEFISFNGKIVAAEKAQIPAVSSAAMYGKGVFTTVAIHDGQPFLWDRHWARVFGDAAKLGLQMWEFQPDGVADSLAALIKKNEVSDGRARVTFYNEMGGGAWASDTGRMTSLLIVTGDPHEREGNLSIGISPHLVNSRSPLAGVKSCSYLENLLSLDEAVGRGLDEAVRLNEKGHITSACMANIFWRKSGALFTPALSTGCLAGTTRGYVMEKLGTREVEAGIDELNAAEGIFLTSAGLGIAEVEEIDGRKMEIVGYDLLVL